MLYDWTGLDFGNTFAGYGYPYANFHNLNLDWILTEIKKILAEVIGHDNRLTEAEATILQNTADILSNAGNITDLENTKVNRAGDTMTGVLAMTNNKITDLGNPTDNTDAANKQYVDIQIANLGAVLVYKGSVATVNDLPPTGNHVGDVWGVESDSTGYVWVTDSTHPNGRWELLGPLVQLTPYLKKDGSTPMTGDLQMDGHKISQVATPAANTDAANKAYVDGLVPDLTPYLKKDGSEAMTGDLQMDGNKITSVATPESLQDAANKEYVDTKISTQATELTLGTVKAAPSTAADTIPIHIDSDGFLHGTPTSASGGDFKADGSVPMTGNLQMGGKDILNAGNIFTGSGFGKGFRIPGSHIWGSTYPKIEIEVGESTGQDTTLEISPREMKLSYSAEGSQTTIADQFVINEDDGIDAKTHPIKTTGNITGKEFKLLDGGSLAHTADGVVLKSADNLVGMLMREAATRDIEFSRNLNLLNTYKIKDVVDPTNPQEVATKQYVDDKIDVTQPDSDWTIIKWKTQSGTTYCLQMGSILLTSVAVTEPWGSLYSSSEIGTNLGNWKIPFAVKPYYYGITLEHNGGNDWAWLVPGSNAYPPSATSIGYWNFTSATSGNKRVALKVIAFGKL